MYQESLNDPEDFWAKHAERLHWFKKWRKVCQYDYHKAEIAWFLGGKLNVAYNCIDRHLTSKKITQH